MAPAAWLALRGEEWKEASVGRCLLQDSRHFPGVQENSRRIQASVSPPAQEPLSGQTAGCFPAGWGLPRLPLSIVTNSQKEQPTEIFWRWERCPECRLHDGAAAAPGHPRRPTVTPSRPCREAKVLPGLSDASSQALSLPQRVGISPAHPGPNPCGPQLAAVFGEADLDV